MSVNEVKIYCFTGTGNSLKISKDIGTHFSKYEILSVPKLMKEEGISIEGDIIGFVFPIYFARPPVIVEEFIEKVQFKNTPYIFAVANGGGLYGRALTIFKKMIKKKGQELDAGFALSMPSNHPKIAGMVKKEQAELFDIEKARAAEIVEIIKNKMTHKPETNFGLLGAFFTYVAFKGLYNVSKAKSLDKELWVNDNCINCGTCEKICPVGNITNSKVKVQWNNRCVNCASCYHHCPQEAIEMGEDNMKRYQNPYVSVEEIINL